MSSREWEFYTLHADQAMERGDMVQAMMLYQQALQSAQEVTCELEPASSTEDLLAIKVASCHNLAKFWRTAKEPEYELKYLQLASEQVLTLVPQCGNKECDAYISSLGCCQGALIDFLKRHPDPKLAALLPLQENSIRCELIARFRLN